MTTITINRAVAQQMLGMLLKVEAELKTYYTTETEEVRALYASITALRAALAQQAEPVADPFADIRDKRMGELNAEQTDRATELWLREQIGPREDYWYPHLQTLFRIIDRLRAQAAPPQRKPLTVTKLLPRKLPEDNDE